MNIAANTLLVLLVPITILSNLALRESQRAQGPDIMGPAFFFVVACVARWIGALVVIGLLVGGGSFDTAAPNRGVQALVLIGTFALVDWAAGITAVACAPQDVAGKPALVFIGRMLSFALPLAMIVWLMPMVQGYLPPAAIWATLILILIVAVGMLPVGYQVYNKTKEQKQAGIQAYWENQQKLTEQGTAEVRALPLDCTLEKLTPYLSGDWPTDVRAEVFSRITKRGSVADELLTMLADDRRRAAGIEFMRQTSTGQFDGFNLKFRELFLKLARQWIGRGANLTSEQTSQLAADCQGLVHSASAQQSETVSFYAAMELWRDVLKPVPQTPEILDARKTLDHWFELYPRPATPASPEAER